MDWIPYIIAAGIVIWLFILSSKSKSASTSESSKKYTLRGGEMVETDSAFDAWTSGDLTSMLEALDTRTNPIDRHFLLLGIVKQTYQERSEPIMKDLLLKIGRQHIDEFAELVDPLREEFDGVLPRVSTFQYLATAYSEDERFDEAIEVCERALEYGLHDGTQSGFEGRIDRINKKRPK